MKTVKFIFLCLIVLCVLCSLILILFTDYFAKGKTKEERKIKVSKIRVWCYVVVALSVTAGMLVTLI